MNPTDFHPDHLSDLRKSGLSDETINMMRVYSTRPADIPKLLGWNPEKAVSALAFPYPGSGGFIRFKVFPPYADAKGTKVKYLQPKGSGAHLYVLPVVRSALKNPSLPLYFAEGEKKAAKAVQEGFPCVGIGGLWNWQEKGEPIEELDAIALADREVFIVPDSDVWSRKDLQRAVYAFASELEKRGAIASVVVMPQEREEKLGLDDFLVAHSPEQFRSLKKLALKHPTFRQHQDWYRDWDRKRRQSVEADKTARYAEAAATKEQIQRAVRRIMLQEKVKTFDKHRQVADLAHEHLARQGNFYRTADGRLFYFHNEAHELLDLEQTRFSRFFTDTFNLSYTEAVFRIALDFLQSAVFMRGVLTEIHTFSYYDPVSGLLAVSNGGEGIWIREPGGQWTKGKNGDAGLLFLPDPDGSEWIPEFGNEGTSLKWLLDLIPFAEDPLGREISQTLLLVWLIQQFFPPFRRTRMIPAFLGPQGSGKTTACRLIGRVLVGEAFEVSGLRREKEDAFIAAVTNRVVHAIDNADTRIDWLEDILARYATGEKYRMRRLHTTNEEASYIPRAILLLTSRDPHFNRPDVSERLLPLYLRRLESFVDENRIYRELGERRGRLWGDILSQIARAADALRAEESCPPVSFRMADFALFGYRLMRSVGREGDWLDAMRRLEKAQMGFAAEGDGLILALAVLLDDRSQLGPTSVRDLYAQVRQVAEDEGFAIPRTVEGFGKKLTSMRRVIEGELAVSFSEERAHARKRIITLRKKNLSMAASPTSPASPEGGYVGDDGDAI